VEAQFEGLEVAAGDAETDEQTEQAGQAEVLPYTLAGIGEKTVRKLVEAGYQSPDLVAAASLDDLQQIPGIGGKTAEKILAAARGEHASPDAGTAATDAPGDGTDDTPDGQA
jgi:DNA uptake protein ComE-like DNA-binding protein